MKKILLATTALTLTAGMAAAEVKVTGDANMGVKYDESKAQEVTTHHEIDFGISGSTTTDNGLTFGASIDLDANNNGTTFESSDPETYVQGAFGRLTFGKVGAASDNVGFGALEVGFDGIGLDNVVEGDYDTGNQDILYTTSMGAIAFAASMSSSSTDDSVSAGVKFSGPVSVSLGYADDGAKQVTSLSVSGSAAGLGYILAATDDSADGNAYGVGVTYGLGNGATMQIGYADSDASTDASLALGMTYGLGGGATLSGGVGSINGTNKADLGVGFKF